MLSNVLGIREVRKLIEIKEGLLKHLAEKLSKKNEEAYHITIIWILKNIAFFLDLRVGNTHA